jgi:hypothetical protein
VGVGEEGVDRGAVAAERRPAEPARHVLEDLVAPALGGLDGGTLAGIGREERRIGHERVEGPGDHAAALEALAVEPEGGDALALESHQRDQHA